jgi:hypothetical protein
MPQPIADLIPAIGKIVVAGLFGGPVAGLQEAGSQAVQIILTDRARNAPARELRQVTARIETSLGEFARSEGLDAGAAGRALINARDVLARFGPSAADLVSADLDPARVSDLVRGRATAILAGLDDVDRRLSETALATVIRALVAKPAQIVELTQEFQRAVLSRLTEQAAATDEVRQAIRGFKASAVLSEAMLPWWKDQYPPSALLRADYGIVPFFGRAGELRTMLDWLAAGPMTALRAFSGPGGIGKTRLLLEACRQAREHGWRAGFAHPGVAVISGDDLRRLGQGHQGVLVVVDYAETRRSLTVSLIEAALRVGVRVRMVLLARSFGDWWQELGYDPGPVGDFLSGPATIRERTRAVATDPDTRAEMTRQAMSAYATALGTPEPADPADPLALRAELYDRVLFIHLRALAAVLGENADGQQGLLSFALRREQAYLDRTVRAQGLERLAGRPIRQAAAIATMAGRCDSMRAALDLLHQVPLLAGQSEADLARVAQLLHGLYPSDSWMAGLQPDVLGEHLVAVSIDDDPELLMGAFSAPG